MALAMANPVAFIPTLNTKRRTKRKKKSKSKGRDLEAYTMSEFHGDRRAPSPDIGKNMYISEHDRRILDRLGAKLQRERHDVELPQRFHAIWDRERKQREQIKKEQEEDYKEYLKMKRKLENYASLDKKLQSKKFDTWERELLVDRITSKDRAAECRLQTIHFQKGEEIHRRQEMAKERLENALDIIKIRKIEELTWRKSIAEELNARIENANFNKEMLIQLIKKRALIDNRLHEDIHQRNWHEKRSLENEHLNRLKLQVMEKLHKIEKIKEEKETKLKDSKRMADLTATMRENLKRSSNADLSSLYMSTSSLYLYK